MFKKRISYQLTHVNSDDAAKGYAIGAVAVERGVVVALAG
jgi:hypothetical protein